MVDLACFKCGGEAVAVYGAGGPSGDAEDVPTCDRHRGDALARVSAAAGVPAIDPKGFGHSCPYC